MAAAPGSAAREEFDEQVKWFGEYLFNAREHWEAVIDKRLANQDYRIPLDMEQLDKAEAGMGEKVRKDPTKYIPPFEDALLAFLQSQTPKVMKELTQPLRLDVQGDFGRNHVTPRGVTSDCVGKLMCVEGIVTRCMVAQPKLMHSRHVHKDQDDGYVESRDHRDTTTLANQVNKSGGGFPKQDPEGRELKMDPSMSEYKDAQQFDLQESPETAPPGQVPRSIQVLCDGDLCDKAKPGDRVQVIGVLKGFPPPMQDFTDGFFPTRLVATSIKSVKEIIEHQFVSDDVDNIRKIAAREDTFKLLGRSFAPAICGHAKVKQGLLLQLLSGTEKNLDNGTHLRGDINVLLVGDPSCGKSQMLRFVMNTAGLAVSTTGKGSSGVGLTAAMIRDPNSSDFHLEAGAMVLADRGVICIDEFDKMNQADRVAIHEAMEQQVVTISKAGMHVTLNARCSVLAAANPIYGNFDPKLDLVKNIGLPDSLLSRFDLIFIVRDNSTEELDRKIADQVLRQHMMRYEGVERKRGVEEIHSSMMERRRMVSSKVTEEATKVFEDQMPMMEDGQSKETVTVDFLQKYIRFAKRLTPVLTAEARDYVAEKYVEMRMRFQSGFADVQAENSERKPRLAVTTRTLEALIRLATAHAKLKLRKEDVLVEDVEVAYQLMLAAREEEVPEAPTAPVVGDDDDDQPGQGGPRRGVKRRLGEAPSNESGTAAKGAKIAKGRFEVFRTLLARCMARGSDATFPLRDLMDRINNSMAPGEDHFLEEEYRAALERLQVDNKVLILDETEEVTVIQ